MFPAWVDSSGPSICHSSGAEAFAPVGVLQPLDDSELVNLGTAVGIAAKAHKDAEGREVGPRHFILKTAIEEKETKETKKNGLKTKDFRL